MKCYCCVLGCNTLWTGTSALIMCRNMVPPSSGWMML